ncbi:hypothetical protein [Roseiconus lacunae]|nr:hypothetical protein [Roseiconus lacunae]
MSRDVSFLLIATEFTVGLCCLDNSIANSWDSSFLFIAFDVTVRF